MLHKTAENKDDGGDRNKHKGDSISMKSDTKSQSSWLSISLEAALGCRANIFQIHKTVKKHTVGNANAGTVTIHPQASPVVCRHVLDTLIALAKVFPSQFLPSAKVKDVSTCDSDSKDTDVNTDDKTKQGATTSSGLAVLDSHRNDTDFWELLIKLDNAGITKKGKAVQKSHVSFAAQDSESSNFYSFDTSPLGQLMTMLSHPVVKRSQLLTDRLLRLLGLVSVGLPDVTTQASSAGVTMTTVPNITTTVATRTTNTATVTAADTPIMTSGSNDTTATATSAPAATEVVKTPVGM